ncbi:DUF1772 domain-containing protein [Shimazuella kribbensis]|uniref:anthrone oxygenase family protein n=1 Tax=Shimazuella kribbensis TaxID=139808 RepID=UPI0003F4C904|nr:anthrone oxygenase family protein [Shimazuella kribbensis]
MLVKIITILSIVTTGLVAGTFFAFSISINPAFKQLSDAQYIQAMQAINKVIQNPAFFFAFMGAVIFTPIAAYMQKNKEASILLFIAFGVYLIGVFGITSFMNVPLNNTLDKFVISSATPLEISQTRTNYAEPWNLWHNIRTTATIIAFVITIMAGMSMNTFQSKKEAPKDDGNTISVSTK